MPWSEIVHFKELYWEIPVNLKMNENVTHEAFLSIIIKKKKISFFSSSKIVWLRAAFSFSAFSFLRELIHFWSFLHPLITSLSSRKKPPWIFSKFKEHWSPKFKKFIFLTEGCCARASKEESKKSKCTGHDFRNLT